MPDEPSGAARQHARARLFTTLYGLATQTDVREFLETLTDVATLLAEHAPLAAEDRADWQCIAVALLTTLDRPRADT